jgi:16S rRNA processing protein RimM
MSGENMDPAKLVELGRVQKPHGLRGELCIELYADSPFIFEGLRRVYLQLPGKKPRPCVLEGWRAHQGRALIQVDRSQGRDQAEAWRGADVLARERDLPPVDEDEIRPEDLIGLPVRHIDGSAIGLLADIQDVAGQEIWFIHDEADNEILLPAVDEFVRDIDLDAGVIVVDPPDGLLDLYKNS